MELAISTVITCILGSATLAEGGNVNQKFENCSIKITAGDLINVYNTTSAERETSPSSQSECNVFFLLLIRCPN